MNQTTTTVLPLDDTRNQLELVIEILVISGTDDLDNGSAEDLKNSFVKGKLEKVPGDHNGTYKTEAFSNSIIRFLE